MVNALGWTLIHFLWQGVAVAVLLAITLALLKRRSAQVRYVVAVGALALMVLLPVATFLTRAPLPHAGVHGVISKEASTYVPRPPAPLPRRLQSDSGLVTPRIEDYLPRVVWLWAVGATVFAIRLTGGILLVERLKRKVSRPAPVEWRDRAQELAKRLGLMRPVDLRESDRLRTPVAMGVLKATIILPASLFLHLPADQVEAVLLHELAHIHRHDYLVNLLQSTVESLLFYHPAIWWVSRIIRIEREHCCDDIAARAVGNPLLYARALTSLEEARPRTPLPVMSAQGGHLMNRIARLAGVPATQRPASPLFGAAATLICATTVMAGSARVQAKHVVPQTPPAPPTSAPKAVGQPVPPAPPAPAQTKPVLSLNSVPATLRPIVGMAMSPALPEFKAAPLEPSPSLAEPSKPSEPPAQYLENRRIELAVCRLGTAVDKDTLEALARRNETIKFNSLPLAVRLQLEEAVHEGMSGPESDPTALLGCTFSPSLTLTDPATKKTYCVWLGLKQIKAARPAQFIDPTPLPDWYFKPGSADYTLLHESREASAQLLSVMDEDGLLPPSLHASDFTAGEHKLILLPPDAIEWLSELVATGPPSHEADAIQKLLTDPQRLSACTVTFTIGSTMNIEIPHTSMQGHASILPP